MIVPVPSVVAPSLKVTVPGGVPAVEVTVAVNVTAVLCVDGFSDEATDVELFALFTVCFSADEALPKKLALPP